MLAAIALVAACTLSSCAKESEATLSGTSWTSIIDYGEGNVLEQHFSFTSATDVTYRMSYTGSGLSLRYNGTYTYQSPKVEMTFTAAGETKVLEGSIVEDKLTTSDGVVYTKD